MVRPSMFSGADNKATKHLLFIQGANRSRFRVPGQIARGKGQRRGPGRLIDANFPPRFNFSGAQRWTQGPSLGTQYPAAGGERLVGASILAMWRPRSEITDHKFSLPNELKLRKSIGQGGQASVVRARECLCRRLHKYKVYISI